MSKKIAVIFDFDDTLAHDSTTDFLKSVGIDTQDFWKKRVDPLVEDGWDPIPAYLYMMIEESKHRKPEERITREKLESFGNEVRLFDGVSRLFSTIHKHVEGKSEDIKVEFFLISSGIGDVVRNTKISHHFTDIWSSDFQYNENNEIYFPKRIVSFTDKTRYIFSISKGLIGPEFKNKPFDVNDKTQSGKFYIPFENMIFVGDGLTDVPCFSLIKKYNGITFAVYDPNRQDKWSRAWKFIQDQRVNSLLPADYSKNSALMTSLLMAIDGLILKIEAKGK